MRSPSEIGQVIVDVARTCLELTAEEIVTLEAEVLVMETNNEVIAEMDRALPGVRLHLIEVEKAFLALRRASHTYEAAMLRLIDL